MYGTPIRPGLLNLLRILPLVLCAASLAAQVTTIPTENTFAIQRGWQQLCLDRVAAAQGHPVDILFLGDSITENFSQPPRPDWPLVGIDVWNKHYAHRNTLNFGVSSDGTEHMLWRLEHMNIQTFHPKVVVLLAGINDAQYSSDDIVAGVKAVLRKTESTFPDAKIILMNILPNGRAPEKTEAANLSLERLADNKTVFSLDLAPFMPKTHDSETGDNWLGLGKDHLHLTEQGYATWADHLDPLLDRLLAPPQEDPTTPSNP
jgi:beta-glucosidase